MLARRGRTRSGEKEVEDKVKGWERIEANRGTKTESQYDKKRTDTQGNKLREGRHGQQREERKQSK